jgi:sialate O-acetylesterase
MVLQQEMPIAIWGKATPGETVQVRLERIVKGQTSAASAEVMADQEGNWAVKLPKQLAGTDYTLTIKGDKNSIAFKNVAIGEVWLCSGQSNMEWSVNNCETPDQVKAGANNPNLRLFTVNKRTSVVPITDQDDLKHFAKWVESGPETVAGFSAVAYHFGQKLQKELGVPVGLIHSSWGGTPCEAWTSLEALEGNPMLKYYAKTSTDAIIKYRDAKKVYDEALAKWKVEVEKAKKDGKPLLKEPTKPAAPNPGTPTVLYNAMIYPLLNFKLRGAIWYQGESNASRAYEYRTLFPTMIQDWRNRFHSELPFMLVQLAPFGNGKAEEVSYAELRDAQLFATKQLPKVGMAVITDVGDEKDIHPKPKQPVGERLAIAALGIEYGQKIEYSGPMLKDVKFKGSTATLTFDHATGGLVAKDGELTGFSLVGSDDSIYPAKAVIKGDTIVVTTDMVSKVVGVRYGWVNFAKPTLNLYNGAGLPASPFRTDDLPLKTQPKK